MCTLEITPDYWNSLPRDTKETALRMLTIDIPVDTQITIQTPEWKKIKQFCSIPKLGTNPNHYRICIYGKAFLK